MTDYWSQVVSYVTYGLCFLFSIDYDIRQRKINRVSELYTPPTYGAMRGYDSSSSEVDFLTHLRVFIPTSLFYSRSDELGAYVPFA